MPRRAPATPESKLSGLASSAFARHYSRNLVLMSSPPGTEMFHFPGCRLAPLCVQSAMAGSPPPGCPIRIPPDRCLLRLPGAFRSLLRPSSPYGAKASVVCPYTLDRKETDLFGPRCIRCNSSTLNYASCQRTVPFREGAPCAPVGMENERVPSSGSAVRGLRRAGWWA